MKKFFKVAGKVLLVLLIAVVVILGAIFVYNRIMMKQEEPLLAEPLGQLV